MALPFPPANTASYGEVSPEPMVSPVGKGGDFSPLLVFWVTSLKPILWSQPQELLGVYGLNQRNFIMIEKGEEFLTTNLQNQTGGT